MAENPVPGRDSEGTDKMTDVYASAPPKSANARRKAMHPKPLFDEQLVLEAFEREGIKKSHAQKMWRYIVQHGTTDLRDIPDFPKAAVALVEREFALFTSKVVKESTSQDGSTTKLLIELQVCSFCLSCTWLSAVSYTHLRAHET